MDSQEKAVEAVRRYYELVDANDVDGLLALFESDAEYHRPGYDVLSGTAALERFYREERVIASGKHTLSKIVAQDQEVAVHGAFDGVLHEGRSASLRFADFFSVTPSATFSMRRTFFYAALV